MARPRTRTAKSYIRLQRRRNNLCRAEVAFGHSLFGPKGPLFHRLSRAALMRYEMPMTQSSDPNSVEVNISTGRGMEIEWKDGHRSAYSFPYLRDACPCAACAEIRRQQGRLPGQARKLKLEELGNPRPIVKLLRAEPVKKYALRLIWNDGHEEGDYSWEYLRDICPCGSCDSKRAAEATGAH